MSYLVEIPSSHELAVDDLTIAVFFVRGDPLKNYPIISQKLSVVCFKNIPNLQFYLHMRRTWKLKYPYSVCHIGCKQAIFSLHKIKASYRCPALFQENFGNDIGVYEIKANNRIIQIVLTNFTRTMNPSQEEINVRTMFYRALQAYNIAQLLRRTLFDSDYQILIGNTRLVDIDLPRQCLIHIGGMILPKNASIMYGSQMGYKLKISDCRTICCSTENFLCDTYVIQFKDQNINYPLNPMLHSTAKRFVIICECIKYATHLINVTDRAQCYQSIALFFVSFLFFQYLLNDSKTLTMSTWLIGILIFLIPFIVHYIAYKKVERIIKPFEDDKEKLLTELMSP